MQDLVVDHYSKAVFQYCLDLSNYCVPSMNCRHGFRWLQIELLQADGMKQSSHSLEHLNGLIRLIIGLKWISLFGYDQMSLLCYSYAELERLFGCLPSDLLRLLFDSLLGESLSIFYVKLLFLKDLQEHYSYFIR